MTNILSIPKTNMSGLQNSNLFVILASIVGMAIGVMASMAFMGLNANAGAPTVRTVMMTPTNSVSSCVEPTGGSGGEGAVLGASVVTPGGGKGADAPGPNNPPMVTKIIGGLVANTTVNMHDTGPGSHNSVTTVNKNEVNITNNNDVSVTNHNDQDADSGDADVKYNTNAGSASTGDASNWNETETSIVIKN